MSNSRNRVGMVGLVALFVVGLIVAPHAVAAPPQRDAPAPSGPAAWMQVTIVDVDPTMVPEFIGIQREISNRARTARTPYRIVSRTETFGDIYRFLIITPAQNLAAFDRPAAANAEATALNFRLEKTIRSQKSYAVRTHHDLGNPLPEDTAPSLIMVNFAKVLPGREQDYYNVMKADFLPHFTELEVSHATGSLAFGGESGFVHLYYFDNFAALDEGSPVVRELGPEGAQAANAKLSGIVTSTEQWITKLVPELSFGSWSPEPESNNRSRP